MGRFVLGFVIGLGVAVLVWALLDRGRPDGSVPAPDVADGPRQPDYEAPPPRLEGAPERHVLSDDPRAPFPAGRALLRIGDAYRFGDGAVLPAGSNPDADVRCLDLRDVARLSCPHGAADVILPVITTRELPPPATTWEHTHDAPPTLAAPRIELSPTASSGRSGVILVQAHDGTVYRVYTPRLTSADLALDRLVEIRFAPVPTRDGGGVAQIPGTMRGTRVPSSREAAYVKALTPPPGLQNRVDAIRLHRNGFVSVPSIPTDAPLDGKHALVREGDLVEALEVKGGNLALIVDGDVANSGGIQAEHGNLALLVEGDLRGEVTVPTGSTVRIRGDVLGTLRVKGGISTVVIDGDLAGKLEMHGICSALIRGRVLDPSSALELHGIHTVYLAGFVDEASIPTPTNSNGIHTLHVEDSDLGEAKTWRIAGYSEVIVGDAVWEKLKATD